MMGKKERNFSPLPRDASLDDLVPEDNFYRRLEARLDLSFVRDLVRPLYAEGGRPSVDPVVFFKLQLVLFFEGLRSERELMGVAAGLVQGQELYFDATKVDANASLDSIAPRFVVEAHLGGLFEEEDATEAEPEASLSTVDEEALKERNAAKSDWISRNGRQRREVKGVWYRRTADFLASKTDPDSSPMKRRDSKGSHLGYYAHYVVDGGKARVILNALVTPFEVTENAPMLDLLWRSAFRWKIRPRQVTGDTAYGTTENIAAVERAGIRAYVPLSGAGKARPYFSKD